MNANTFTAWLVRKGFIKVDNAPDANTYEKDDVRYIVKINSFGKRTRLSPNRWSSMETWRYNRRFINRNDKLDFV